MIISPVERAKALRKELNLATIPTNMEYVCMTKKWKIVYVSDLPKDCFALGMKYHSHSKQKTFYRIHLCEKFCPTRNAFSLAHEIGHIVLEDFERYDLTFIHSDFIGSKTIQYLDRRANAFAAEFLMPLNLILKNLHYSISEMARIFGVSEDAMIYRLNKLKLLETKREAAPTRAAF